MRTGAVLLIVCAIAADSPAAAPDDPRVTPVVLAYRRTRPAVVNISTTKLAAVRLGPFGRGLADEMFPAPLVRKVPVHSLGSGFLISPHGYLVTNAHVVRRAQKITVTLADKSRYAAKVICADPAGDLAVLKIEPKPAKGPRSFPHLRLGRSDDLMVGETVIAIGNPMGLANTLTTGVISATGRDLEFGGGVKMAGLIQTDAPINPGNSGGPLLNVKGELIGINTAVRAGAQNIGFAVPIDSLAKELPALLDFERIRRMAFGASAAQRRTPKGEGVYVTAVRRGAPAAGKLKVGDRLLSLNGNPLRQIPDYLCEMMENTSSGKVRLQVLRGGKKLDVTVAIRAKPRPQGKALAKKLFGMTLREITPELARDLRLGVERGLIVVDIEDGEPADRLGIQLKDVVFQIGRFYVKDLDILGMALEDVRAGQNIAIGILRGNVRAWTRIRARRAPASQPREGPSTDEAKVREKQKPKIKNQK